MWERHELETFLTLAADLHFGRTATRLRLTTSRVSQTIKKLERLIGAPLFERTSRRVGLTPLGRQLADDLRPLASRMDEVIRSAMDAARGISGLLRVGYSAQWVGDLTILAADAFSTRYPDCVVQVSEIQLSDPLGQLRDGALDLQISAFPVEEHDITRGPVVFSEPRALIVPSAHPLATCRSVSLEDLAGTPLVSIAGRAPAYWTDFHYPRYTPSGRLIPRGPAAGSWSQMLSYVATGKGVTPASARAAWYHDRPDVAFVPFSDARAIDYGLLWPAARETSRTRDFAETVLAVRDR
ncbi:LysR family transcriptional regulator [Longispora albida]|uniref:LysR family transcriptional regulator n=1 Tax=Longispora albida TaxID=203523 RepID=UPI000379B817|nr:LysR family transcriptional regulator [Longispora albida]